MVLSYDLNLLYLLANSQTVSSSLLSLLVLGLVVADLPSSQTARGPLSLTPVLSWEEEAVV